MGKEKTATGQSLRINGSGRRGKPGDAVKQARGRQPVRGTSRRGENTGEGEDREGVQEPEGIKQTIENENAEWAKPAR